jgi:hypothetical protein
MICMTAQYRDSKQVKSISIIVIIIKFPKIF